MLVERVRRAGTAAAATAAQQHFVHSIAAELGHVRGAIDSGGENQQSVNL